MTCLKVLPISPGTGHDGHTRCRKSFLFLFCAGGLAGDDSARVPMRLPRRRAAVRL